MIWLGLHLLLYAVLDVATLVVLDGPRGAAVDLGWGLPLHLGALALAAVALMFLPAVCDLPPLRFRVAAVGVFVAGAVVISLPLTGGDVTVPAAVLPMHLLMGLLVVQPRP